MGKSKEERLWDKVVAAEERLNSGGFSQSNWDKYFAACDELEKYYDEQEKLADNKKGGKQ